MVYNVTNKEYGHYYYLLDKTSKFDTLTAQCKMEYERKDVMTIKDK